MDELSSINHELLALIKPKINQADSSFDLWFDGFELLEINEHTAKFSTPSMLKKSVITTKYKSLIADAMEEMLGFMVSIDIMSEMEIRKEKEEAAQKYAPIPILDLPDLTTSEELAELRQKNEEESEENVAALINGTAEKKTRLMEYTFDNFVEGSSNKFAKAACYAVAREPNTYNPLFIYGHSGLGKTHLLYAVINYMRENHPDLNIVYKKCESFLDELIQAIKFGNTRDFKDKYRSADVLLIDDIQFLAGKEQTQEEFFHTFSALYESDKQIILTSDRPPKEIKPLEDRLRTRFEGGLLADVQPPSFELRIAIIKKKADSMGLTISNDMIEYMAERLQNNIRQIEGALKRIYAMYSFSGGEITKKSIDDIISIIDPGNIPTDLLIERILTTVSKYYGESVENIKSKKKTNSIANARHVSAFVIRKMTDLSLKEIGRVFGRDYSTVISSINKIELNIRTVKNYESEINMLIKEIRGV